MHPGLCETCAFHREIRSGKGSLFHLCERSRTDPRYPLYPPIPVLACAGHRATGNPGEAPRARDRDASGEAGGGRDRSAPGDPDATEESKGSDRPGGD
jgi:hypothetical protein